jgi:hypothetical protein
MPAMYEVELAEVLPSKTGGCAVLIKKRVTFIQHRIYDFLGVTETLCVLFECIQLFVCYGNARLRVLFVIYPIGDL